MPTRVTVPVEVAGPLDRVSAYLIGGLVIDPGAYAGDLVEACQGRDIEHLAVTHHHPDHVGGVADLVAAHDPTVWGRTGRTAAFQAATGVTPDRTFGEGTTIPARDGVEVVDTPGHAPEHVAFATDGLLVTGDLLVAEGSVVVGAPEGDLRAYLSSLRRIHARDPARCLPAHGPVVDDPSATCERLLAHRLDRERRVATAVHAGHERLGAILDAAYEKDLSGVRDLAEATVRAHLEKLAVEGRVRWDGERARPV